MSLCEIYSDIECLGVTECQYGAECEYLACDGTDCGYYDTEHGCTHMNCCKKER